MLTWLSPRTRELAAKVAGKKCDPCGGEFALVNWGRDAMSCTATHEANVPGTHLMNAKPEDPLAHKMTDDEIMDLWRTRIGTTAVPTSYQDQPFCRIVNADSILTFCLAVGDLNPLWLDSTYAAKSHFGQNFAPPQMVFGLAAWSMIGGVLSSFVSESGEELPRPGAGGVQGGMTIEWLRRFQIGDVISTEARLVDVITRKSKTWGRTFDLVTEFALTDQKGELVASARFSHMGTERRPETRSHILAEPRTWTPGEIEEIRELYAAQPSKIRGVEPRYWEDVAVGEVLPEIVKGPYTENSYIAFYAGVPLRSVVATDEVFWNHSYTRKVKGWPNRNDGLGEIELTRQGVPAGHRYHFDYDSAAHKGLAAPIDVGHQRTCWLAQLATMWMGDDGFLKRLETRHTGVNMAGDLTTCRGVVREKDVVAGEHVVRCEVWCENHRGHNTEGTATIVLPSRESGNRFV